MKQSPIFTKSYDLMNWLVPRTLAFPKSQRGVLARQLQQQVFCLNDLLVDAAMSKEPLAPLRTADAALAKLRTYLRLSKDLSLLTINQYEHASRLVAETGRLLGGWRKSLEKTAGVEP